MKDSEEQVRNYLLRHVPETASGVVEIVSVVREPGFRAMVTVRSAKPEVDPVGVCVGLRGERLKPFQTEFPGEYIDVVRWDESPRVLIGNALAPLVVAPSIELEADGKRAWVAVERDKFFVLSKKDRAKVALVSRLLGVEIQLVPAGS